MKQNRNVKIGIIGAGIAGLRAGLELLTEEFSVTILEARSRTGGRIHSMTVDSRVIETGPEFIHGELKNTLQLLKRYNIQAESINGKMYRVSRGLFQEIYDRPAGWEELLEKMKNLDADISFSHFLDTEFPGNQYVELRIAAVRYAEGFDLADVQTASTKALIKEWENEDEEQYRIPSGYSSLTDAMEKEFLALGGEIFLNHPVSDVHWSPEQIIISVIGKPIIVFDKLIVTVPLAILNKSSTASEYLNFLPPIAEQEKAFNKIGFGTVIKIVIIFNHSFWKEKIPDALFLFSDGFIPTWWTAHPAKLPILTAWLGGPKAEELADKKDSFFLDKIAHDLTAIFTVDPEEVKKKITNIRVFNWKNEEWSRGAYSYSRVGSENAKAVLAQPVNESIYFAGEAFYDGPHPGTVEAAIVSGLYSAKQIIKITRLSENKPEM